MRRPDFTRRVAVTGLGIVSPVGQDIATAWDNLVDGRVRPAAHHPLGPLAPTSARPPARSTTSTPTPGWTSRPSAAPTRTSSSASPRPSRRWPTRASRSRDDNRDDIGVIFGSGVGGPQLLMDEPSRSLGHEAAPASVSPFFIANMLPDTASGQIAIETGIRGPEHVHRDGLLDGHAQHRRGGRGHPARRLHRRHHRLDRDARSTRSATSASRNMRGMGTPREGEGIETVSRPFDRDAQRLRAGRGRRRDDARGPRARQGARRHRSTPRSWATAPRPTPGTSSSPSRRATASRRAMEMALERHGVPRDEIDLINPHGTSTPLGDLREAQAIWSVFGDRTPEVAISGTKSMTGHLMGAAGAVEGVFTVLSVHHQVRAGDAQLPRPRPRDQPRRRPRRVARDGDPLRDVRQHRPRRPQRRGHLQALRRRLRPQVSEASRTGHRRLLLPHPLGRPRRVRRALPAQPLAGPARAAGLRPLPRRARSTRPASTATAGPTGTSW